MYITEADYEVVVIGGGVAGLSAALLLARSLVKVGLVHNESGALYRGETHNFLTNDGESKSTIENKGRKEVLQYPSATLIEGVVVAISKSAVDYTVDLADGKSITTKKLVFALGLRTVSNSTGIDGFDARLGFDVFTCPYCHGYELMQGKVVLVGTSENDVTFIRLLSNWFKDLTYITHRGASKADVELGIGSESSIEVIEGNAIAISGSTGSPMVAVSNGLKVEANTIFLADLSTNLSWPLIDSLGIERGLHPLTKKAIYKTDAVGRTDLGSVFIIGDARTGFSTLAGAAHEGMIAGYMLTNDIIEERERSATPEPAFC